VVVVVVLDGGDDDGGGGGGAQLQWKCRYYSSIWASLAWVVCFFSCLCISFQVVPVQGCTGWERPRLWVQVGTMGLGPVPLPCNGMCQMMVMVQGCTGLKMVTVQGCTGLKMVMVHGTGRLEAN
jgi:hypothetical protein